MRSMTNPNQNPAALANDADGNNTQRLQFELALDVATSGRRPSANALHEAAAAVGADVVFVLPAPSGEGVTAVVRLNAGGNRQFLQVTTAGVGFVVADEAEIEEHILGLARASVDVLERMSTDRAIREPLSAAR